MQIVIGGDEEVAVRLAEDLMVSDAVTLIWDPRFSSAKLDRLDVETVIGSISSPDVLERAGVAKADFFIACDREDERNLVASVTAKKLGCAKSVCFFRRPEYVRPVGKGEDSIASTFGIDTVIWPAQQLAQEIVRIVCVRGALDVEVLEGGRVRMRKYRVESGSPAAGRTVRDLGVPKGVVLVGVRRGESFSLPRGDTRLEAGDKVLAMGDFRGLEKLATVLRPSSASSEVGPATIIGGGSVGQMVAEGLALSGGFEVKVIESDSGRCDEIARLLPKALVICGNGTDLDLLASEGIDKSQVLVAVTDNDEKNLLVSLLARQLSIPRIVTRAGSVSNERLFERVGIDVVRSALGSAIRAVVDRAIGGRSDLRVDVEHGDARIVEMTIPDAWKPITLESIELPVFAIVGAIVRGDKTIIPRGDDELRGGDRVLVFCERDAEAAMRKFVSRPDGPAA